MRKAQLDTTGDVRLDGFLLTRGGQRLDPARAGSLASLKGVLPDNGVPVQKKVVFINGIMTDAKLHEQDLQQLANVGFEVVGVHNATAGMVDDVAQTVGDKLGLTRKSNRAIETTAALIEQALANPAGVEFIGHSQGATILSDALGVVEQRLKAKGLSAKQIADQFGKLELETMAGAAMSFPNGVHVKHLVNNDDLIPLLTGRGLFPSTSSGAVVRFGQFGSLRIVASETVAIAFARTTDNAVHGVGIYASHQREVDDPQPPAPSSKEPYEYWK